MLAPGYAWPNAMSAALSHADSADRLPQENLFDRPEVAMYYAARSRPLGIRIVRTNPTP